MSEPIDYTVSDRPVALMTTDELDAEYAKLLDQSVNATIAKCTLSQKIRISRTVDERRSAVYAEVMKRVDAEARK